MRPSEAKPRHIAIIMDGNGRWATSHNLPRIEGHKAGLEAIRAVVRYLSQIDVEYLTLFTFSTENWKRPRKEIKGLLSLLEHSLLSELNELKTNNVRLMHIGRLDRLPSSLVKAIEKAMKVTKQNTGLKLNLAFDYGSRSEIVEATRRIILDGLESNQLTENRFSEYLFTAGLPDVDLLIRTSGEYRLSNFLLWQSAYSECYFTDVLWPDFDEKEMGKAIDAYCKRQRRFGGLMNA
jgi:undecaprenyl diphosphate synthase